MVRSAQSPGGQDVDHEAMTCVEPALESRDLPEVDRAGSPLQVACDGVVLGDVDVLSLGGRTHLVTRVAPTGPRGLWNALQAAGALAEPTEVDGHDHLAGLHLDPRVNGAHLAFLATL
jgi:hypothetical protein